MGFPLRWAKVTARAKHRKSRQAALLLAAAAGSAGTPAAAEPAQAPAACLSSYESAQRLKLEKKLLSSKKALIVCARNDCPEVLRRDCAEWLADVESALPSVVVAARSEGREVTTVRLLVDGEIVAESLDGSALALDPGPHVFRLEPEDGPALEQTLVIREGEKNRVVEVELDQTSAGARAPNRTPIYGLAALGAVGIGSFVYFGLRSHSAKQDLEACKGHCPVDDVRAVERDQVVADVSLGLGLVALGAAAYLYFGEAKEAPATKSAWRFGVTPLARGAAASVGARF